MGIAYSIAFFIACGIFLAAGCIWGIHRGVDENVATLQTRFDLGGNWERPLRLAAYVQLVVMGLVAVWCFVLAAAVTWMAAS